MKPKTKTILSRISGLLILAQSLWAVIFYASQRLTLSENFGSLFLAPGIYLVEIVLMAGAAAAIPWFKWKRAPVYLWIIAGAYAALALTDFWTVGYYLSPSFILTLVNAAYLSPAPDQFTWRNFSIFVGSAFVQFLFSLAPFLKNLIF